MDRDYILAPKVVSVSFTLDAVFAQSQSMYLLNELEKLSGLSSWLTETYQAMPEALRRENLLMSETGYFIISGMIARPLPGENLPQFVDRILQGDPHAIAAQMEAMWVLKCEDGSRFYPELREPDLKQMFRNRDTFLKFMTEVSAKPEAADLWNEAYDLFQQPHVYLPRLQQHIHTMWDHFMGAEWERQLPSLQESVQAFQRANIEDMTIYDAIRVVAGRDMRGTMDNYEPHIDAIVFSPSPHLGPYIAKMPVGSTLRLLYGARLPRGAQARSSALSRSDLLIRMNALADDTRLRILEMLTKQEEMRAQDIIEALNLSQSSVSRHLSQLSATGFLIERRRDVNKVYSLNVDRIVDTVRALTNFLAKE